MATLKKLWQGAVTWLESGDLVPLIVLVSAVHYAAILAAHDLWPVAVAIGCLVDLGHWRTVRAAVRYAGSNNAERAARWLMALAMTAVSVAYQQRFYSDWWLSLPLPFLIASLAWLGHVDRATGKRMQAAPEATAERAEATPTAQDAEAGGYLCGYCGDEFGSQNALNAHQRFCKRRNGHSKRESEKITEEIVR